MSHDCWSSFSVGDLEEANDFYSRILGLNVGKLDMGILEIHCPGGNKIWVYPKADHKPATFTVLNLIVEDIEKEVGRLNALGITMEQYPKFEADGKGIVRGHTGPPIAWFEDPAGNILAIMEAPADS